MMENHARAGGKSQPAVTRQLAAAPRARGRAVPVLRWLMVSAVMAAATLGLTGVTQAQHADHATDTTARAAGVVIQRAHTFPSRPGVPNVAVYFDDVRNTASAADELVSASTTVAKRAELHEMVMEGQVMRMRELPKIDLPAEASVDMAKGSAYHVMLIGLHEPLKTGDKFPLTLRFRQAGEQTVTVEVLGVGNGGKHQAGHDHHHGHGEHHKH
ncbi:MAG: copper chaperone PCu(A)C [Lautropia sp.]|nr:copper chaperone PCu(A)C [Lautropia sp.]